VKTVLIFSWFYLPHIGGAELFVREIVSRLAGRYRFVIVTARGDRALPPRETRDGAEIVRVGLGRSMDKLLYPLPAVVRALELDSVSLVHAIMVNASALASYFYLLVRHRPSLLTIQNGDSEEYVRRYLGPAFPIYPRLHRPFDRIHAISRHLRDQAVGYGADPGRISIIPNGVDTTVFSRSAYSREELDGLRSGLGLDGSRIVLSVSRLVLKNGIGELIQAMPAVASEHPDALLLLIGDGEDRAQLERMAKELRVETRVRFLGRMEPTDVARHLCLGEVFVRPSVSEGLGTSFLEALACEVPIVGTPVGGIPEFLTDGKTGLFCEPGNPESIARAVSRLLSDGELAGECATRGKAMVEASYQWDGVVERIAGLYDDLLRREAR
jgi:glycosyltransferase involved in cell wall biosynthesis